MAMQEENPAAVLPSAQFICNAFVEQYYHVLHHSPHLVYKFYQDSSVLSRPDSDGIMTSVTTMQAINEKIQSFDFKNYKAEIKTADAQDSFQSGVIILVTGCLTGTDNLERKFTQTFFLAPQEKGYYVLNDVFRYVEESEQLEMITTSVNGISEGDPTTPLTSDPVVLDPAQVPTTPALDTATTHESEDLHNGAEVYDPSDNEEGSGLEEEVINEPRSQSEPSTVISADSFAAQGEKKSYASILKVNKAAAATASIHVPSINLRWTPTKNEKKHLDSAKSSHEPDPSAPTSDSVPENSNAHERVEGHSIYIRNLPLNATVPQLEEEFKRFGSIKHGGVQVRSNKGFCFGFVEFESLDSMLSAIKESPIKIGGSLAVVQEKRTTTRVGSSGRGRYPSGRGGFRSGSFRGHGDFGGRGYGRSDFRNYGEFSSQPKGPDGRNRDSSYRRVDQSGGRRFD